MGKRVYTTVFQNIAVAAVQDLLALYAGASMGMELHGITLGQVTGITQQNLNISVKRLLPTVSAGTGGAAVTPRRKTTSDAAATVTARRNDTGVATSSGGTEVLLADVFNTLNGYVFFWPPEDRPDISLNSAAIFSLDAAPSASMNMSGTLIFAETL